MKKTTTIFAAIALSAASLASARGVDLPEWNHANDSNRPLANLQEVHYPGVKPTAKKDDRIKFTATNHVAPESDAYQSLGRNESR
ncbi:hypothetical protein [Neisseria sp. 74A18]|uniref:hypothetical protein n=1 Tax=Neisseria sp. 74A18 TaxID=1696094 RepID=UPI0006CACF28|nr:hypothetical protein [Neisseria sp. 74A18]KPN73137.1 hypothetical protein AKG43_09650 [Neisseria sp. 74A18]